MRTTFFVLGTGCALGSGATSEPITGRDGRADESTTIHWTLPSQLCRLVAIRGNLNGIDECVSYVVACLATAAMTPLSTFTV